MKSLRLQFYTLKETGVTEFINPPPVLEIPLKQREITIPPMTPYVKMSTSKFGAKVLMKKKNAAMMLPAIHTLRTPNLFDKADATGPAN